ncbi:MAG: helix-turn-helix domain-containing protein [Lawsonibacter sp.]|mgnify:CR=1 FL=1|nr:helix-turn-helix domain-containing protein [Lawsonibacter sp.]
MREILAKRLRECRKRGAYTQRDVSIYCDLTEKAYQNYEVGRQEPRLSIIVRIAKFYKVSLDYLVGLTDDPTPYNRNRASADD